MVTKSSLIAACIAIISFSCASAGLLGLPMSNPDISSFGIAIDYIADTDDFTAKGFPSRIYTDGGPVLGDGINGAGRLFDLKAKIDSNGEAQSATISIYGKISALGIDTAGTLLLQSSNLLGFGFQSDGAQQGDFEFLFATDGGALAAHYGTSFGVQLHSGGLVPGTRPTAIAGPAWATFDANFFNSVAIGTADTFSVVPEPSSFTILAGLGLGLFLRNRTRTRRKSLVRR